MSCLLDDIIESVIRCETTKATWTDLVHSFEGLSDTKENRIMDLKLEYQTFKAKPFERLSQTYTHYKTLFNKLSDDGVNLFKHQINVGFVYIHLEKCFVYEDNLIQRRYSDTKKALITTLSTTPISTNFFSNHVVQDFQENSDDENPKTFQSKNKGLVAETFDWDEEEVANNEELTQVKVLMALGDDELTSPWDIDHEMVPKSKDWVERHNPDSKLLNFNTGRILVLKSQAVNECLKLTEASNDP
ncbi:hypothetical protein Tco_1029800 [Tanacetum coccineum]|uniref:Uncharacterized protein n=1 Tax=Tanacetum coccineum TaxID=301880 RepID=A0ABQ5G517_9ASTR